MFGGGVAEADAVFVGRSVSPQLKETRGDTWFVFKAVQLVCKERELRLSFFMFIYSEMFYGRFQLYHLAFASFSVSVNTRLITLNTSLPHH